MTHKTIGAVLYRSPLQEYPTAVSARGMRIRDANGRQYLDMSGGAAVSCLGHSHPDVVTAVQKQMGELAFAHTAFFTSQPQEQLAEALQRRFKDKESRVYFLSGGSEANETALKLAWQYWLARGKPDKKIIISREHSYHGNTFGVLSASGNAARRRASAAPLVEWPRIPPCYPYRYIAENESASEYGLRAAEYLDAAVATNGADNIAAFIVEPVVGSSLGVVAAAPGYLARIREICDRHAILLIADEIMCGSGRTGDFFAHEADGIKPDIVTLAKGVGGGYIPLAAAIVGANIAAVLTNAGFVHGHTYVGHPVACAAGLAVQNVIDREGLLERTREYGDRFLSLLKDAFEDHPQVGEIRGRGLFAGIEFVSDKKSRDGFSDRSDLPDAIRLSAMSHGLICYPGAITVDSLTVPHIMLAPPMIVEDRHLAECMQKLAKVIDDIKLSRRVST